MAPAVGLRRGGMVAERVSGFIYGRLCGNIRVRRLTRVSGGLSLLAGEVGTFIERVKRCGTEQ